MVKQEFITSENEHWYPSEKIEGLWYPSATTITGIFPKGKGFEMYLTRQNSYEEAQESLKEAGERGTRIHEATERLEKGEKLYRDSYALDEWQRLVGFVNWHQKYKPKAIAIEERVVSDTLRLGGTIDRVYKIQDDIVILDIKTSGNMYESFWLQVAAYYQMWNEKHRKKPKKLATHTAILRLTPKRKDYYEYEVHDAPTILEDFMSFQSLKQLWHYINPKKVSPKLLEVPTELTLWNHRM